MTFKEWTGALRNSIEILTQTREEDCLKIANDTMALVKRRIINFKKDSDGKAFGQYSEAVVPVWFFGGQDTKRDTSTSIEELLDSKGYWASYKDWREVNNLDTDDINFSFTGEMWKSLVAVTVKKSGDSVSIGIISNNEYRDKILGYHLNRFPELLALDGKEEKLMETLNQERFNNALKKAGIL